MVFSVYRKCKKCVIYGNSILQTKYLYEGYNLRDVTSDDVAVVPEDNIFSSDGASDWAKEEMQKAADL